MVSSSVLPSNMNKDIRHDRIERLEKAIDWNDNCITETSSQLYDLNDLMDRYRANGIELRDKLKALKGEECDTS